jgi:hypothetical protein
MVWPIWYASCKKQVRFEQEIVIFSQLHIINVQCLHDLDHLAVWWNTTDIHSICPEECKSLLIEIEMMQKLGTPVPYSGFPLTNLKFKRLHLKMLINTETPLTNSICPPPCQLQWSGNWHLCFSSMTTSSRRFVPCLPFDWAFSSASYQSCDRSPRTYGYNTQYCSPTL